MAEAGGGSAYLMGTRNKGSPVAGAPRGRLRARSPRSAPRPRRAAPSPGRGTRTRGETPPGPQPYNGAAMAKPPGTPRLPIAERARLQHRCLRHPAPGNPRPQTAPPRPRPPPAPPQPPAGRWRERNKSLPSAGAGGCGLSPGGVVVTRQEGGAKLLPHRFLLRKMQR